MEEIKKTLNIESRLAAKYRKNAMDWHKSRHGERPVERAEGIEKRTESLKSAEQVENESVEQELALIGDLKNIINDSDLEENRKPVFLGALNSAEQKLRAGAGHQRLPDIVRNLAEKTELRGKVLEATKHYSVDGQSFYYLWGLE